MENVDIKSIYTTKQAWRKEEKDICARIFLIKKFKPNKVKGYVGDIVFVKFKYI